jgi:hypothetical protein
VRIASYLCTIGQTSLRYFSRYLGNSVANELSSRGALSFSSFVTLRPQGLRNRWHLRHSRVDFPVVDAVVVPRLLLAMPLVLVDCPRRLGVGLLGF